jgi:hypothetical protein
VNAHREPVGEHEPEPDPEEPVTRWEITACVCGGLLYRPARRGARLTPEGWRHVSNRDAGQRP